MDGIEDLMTWDMFAAYVHAPYMLSPHQRDINDWCLALMRRRGQGEDLRLSFVEVKSELTGRKFEAFTLNEQIYFSHDPAVLTLPHPPSTKDALAIVPPDQLAGIWLHDYGGGEQFIRQCEDKILAQNWYNLENLTVFHRELEKEPHAARIFREINGHLADPRLPGNTANHVSTMQLRLATENPIGDYPHRDVDIDMGWPESRWGLYSLDGRKRIANDYADFRNAVSCPVGATVSQLACGDDGGNADMRLWGIRHMAQGHPDGRAILLVKKGRYEGEPVRDIPSPWKITPYILAP